MKRPSLCAVIVGKDPPAIEAEPFIDLYEVRIDLVGDGWQELVKQLRKPWIACNRLADEGGQWEKSEAGRIEELLKAAELGADLIDIELKTENVAETVKLIKERAKCLVSSHELNGTPSLDEMKETVHRQIEAGADVCKVVTTALKLEDNLSVLQLIAEFPRTRMVSFAMGPLGVASRILCPLVGGYFTYASIEEGKESASGQMTAMGLRHLYEIVR